MKSLGDKLYVGCSTDEFNLSKGKRSVFSFSERSEMLRSCRYVDKVFPETCWDQKARDIRKYNVDIFAMGDDWRGKFDFLEELAGCKVVYLSRTPGISSSILKGRLQWWPLETVPQ
jgi:glycerol-3-phosphate cytidylyltransferase